MMWVIFTAKARKKGANLNISENGIQHSAVLKNFVWVPRGYCWLSARKKSSCISKDMYSMSNCNAPSKKIRHI